jgi:hypothetical protein
VLHPGGAFDVNPTGGTNGADSFDLEILPHQSVSNALDCRAGKIVRIGMPNDWAAAPLTFQVSPNGCSCRKKELVDAEMVYHAELIAGERAPGIVDRGPVDSPPVALRWSMGVADVRVVCKLISGARDAISQLERARDGP